MFAAAVAAAAVAQEATDPYAAVDAAWQHRSDGQKDGWADPAVAKRIDDTARAALKAHPGELEAAWRPWPLTPPPRQIAFLPDDRPDRRIYRADQKHADIQHGQSSACGARFNRSYR